ncbi:MAG: SDR family NAD(P)-dependent oxidoreductase [Balneolaceae bacterium]
MNNRTRFTDKHLLITGAARGIGFEIARQFLLEEARVTIFDVHGENLESAVRQLTSLSSDVTGEVVDITDRQQVFDAVKRTEERSKVDILINNAGICHVTPFLRIEEDEWNRVLDINLTGMFHVSQAVCRIMAERREGVVINMASKNALDGEEGHAHYNASKAGVVLLTKTMALELANTGIRVNAVCPGYIRTPMSRELDSPEFVEKFVDRYIPLNRPGNVEDIAPAFLFLASEESRFMTGQEIVLDGGQLAGQKPF